MAAKVAKKKRHGEENEKKKISEKAKWQYQKGGESSVSEGENIIVISSKRKT